MIAATSPFSKRAVALSLVFGLALVAAGCGRKGALEPPQAAVATPTPTPTAGADISQQFGRKHNPPITPPKSQFVLDPLL